MLAQCEIKISEKSQVGEVRRQAIRLAQLAEFSEVKQSEVAIIATEMATNLVLHAGHGCVLLRIIRDSPPLSVELISIDGGPGMADVQGCMQDGYSTAGTAGNGLGAIRRLSSEFDIFSQPGRGTVILSRLHAMVDRMPRPKIPDVGMVSQPAPHESVCGDGWSVKMGGDHLAVMVADGLGHGPYAQEASLKAVEVFETNSDLGPLQVLTSSHRALQGTRGAAMATAMVDLTTSQLQYAGVGNISATLILQTGQRSLMSYNGIVGFQFPKAQQIDYPWVGSALLIMHSDGIQTRWRLEDYPGLAYRHPAVIAAVLYRDFLRGRDDATIVATRFVGTKA